MSGLPEYFFRIRENGVAVFRVDTENRYRRIEMDQIAVVNVKGDIKPRGNRTLTDADLSAIEVWMAKRDASGEAGKAQNAIEHLNLAADWAQRKATPEELTQVTDDLLMAMHDLRAVLVKKKADQAD